MESPELIPGVEPYYHDAEYGQAIYLGDCRELLPLIPDGAVDLVLTDIPYGKVNRPSAGLRDWDKGSADVVTFSCNWLGRQAGRIASGSVYVFCGTEQVSALRARFVRLGMTTRLGVWEKTNADPANGQHFWLSSIECCVFARHSKATFNGRCRSPVWRGCAAYPKFHTTTKPLWLFDRLVQASSDTGDLVCDPCMGSGTTLVAAKRHGCKGIGIELEERYCEIAAKRLQQGVFKFAPPTE